MFGFEIVMGAAVLDVVLGGEAEPEQHRGVDLALGDAHDLDGARERLCDPGGRLVGAAIGDEVALVEHDEVGASDLVFEHFLDRIVVIERIVG